jgi:hypothetical protein
MIKLQRINADIAYDTAIVTSLIFRKSFNCKYNPRMDYAYLTDNGIFIHVRPFVSFLKIYYIIPSLLIVGINLLPFHHPEGRHKFLLTAIYCFTNK